MAKQHKVSPEDLLKSLLEIHIPKEYLDYFELAEVRNKADCYELVLHEREDLLPHELRDKQPVLDGFCNPVNILSHSFSLKRIYLIVRRRRWKVAGSEEHYSNSYDLHPKGAKLTPQFVAFLKAVDRIPASKF